MFAIGGIKCEPKVSIVVPAYNVEPYIENCIESIIKQTYKNIEIIAVDDGSEDSTPRLLDQLAMQHKMLRVIHKDNSGVSAARNDGMDVSTGEYLTFVDGDDYLAPDFVEYMMGIVNQTGSEFCLSKCCFTKKNEDQTIKDKIEILNQSDATALLLSPAIIVGCWNKIFKKSLLVERGIRFSTELFYGEGLRFITTVSQCANCIGVGKRKIYYYRRNNALSATTRFNINSIYNGERALNAIESDMSVSGKNVETMMKLHRCMYCIGALVKLRNNKVEKKYLADYKRWLTYIRRNIFYIVSKKDVSLYRKLLLIGGCISPKIMARMDLIRRKKIAENSVEK